jgi:hypothetical protein
MASVRADLGKLDGDATNCADSTSQKPEEEGRVSEPILLQIPSSQSRAEKSEGSFSAWNK